MILPPAPGAYSQDDQTRLRNALRRADEEALKRGRDIELGAGRLILTAPDGGRWAVVVANDGALSTVSA